MGFIHQYAGVAPVSCFLEERINVLEHFFGVFRVADNGRKQMALFVCECVSKAHDASWYEYVSCVVLWLYTMPDFWATGHSVQDIMSDEAFALLLDTQACDTHAREARQIYGCAYATLCVMAGQ